MSTYNDYLIKANVGFVDLAAKYCNRIDQGIDDCKLRNKINILAMYLDTIPRLYNENCVTSDELESITSHIQWLLGCWTLGTLDTSDIPQPVGTSAIPSTSGNKDYFAWNTTIGTTPITITFDNALGTSGSSWGISYIIYSNITGLILDPHIINRTQYGFTVYADEDDVHFEGTAILKMS